MSSVRELDTFYHVITNGNPARSTQRRNEAGHLSFTSTKTSLACCHFAYCHASATCRIWEIDSPRLRWWTCSLTGRCHSFGLTSFTFIICQPATICPSHHHLPLSPHLWFFSRAVPLSLLERAVPYVCASSRPP